VGKRLDTNMRRTVLLRGAMRVAMDEGFAALTHARVAAVCGCSSRTVYRWSRSRKVLWEKVAGYARVTGCPGVTQEYENLMGERAPADA